MLDLDAIEARLTESQKESDVQTSLCVECGPDVYFDEEGCCRLCGADCVGPWADRANRAWQAQTDASHDIPALIAEVRRLREERDTVIKPIIDLATLAACEACANICDLEAEKHIGYEASIIRECAEAIRARKP